MDSHSGRYGCGRRASAAWKARVRKLRWNRLLDNAGNTGTIWTNVRVGQERSRQAFASIHEIALGVVSLLPHHETFRFLTISQRLGQLADK